MKCREEGKRCKILFDSVIHTVICVGRMLTTQQSDFPRKRIYATLGDNLIRRHIQVFDASIKPCRMGKKFPFADYSRDVGFWR
jgi:hypothetical protein